MRNQLVFFVIVFHAFFLFTSKYAERYHEHGAITIKTVKGENQPRVAANYSERMPQHIASAEKTIVVNPGPMRGAYSSGKKPKPSHGGFKLV